MEKVEWKVEGMTCSTCALSVSKYLEKQGLKDIKVSLADGDVSFDSEGKTEKEKLIKGISQLGYKVVETQSAPPIQHSKFNIQHFLSSPIHKFFFCTPFTLLLVIPMLPIHIEWLMNPWLQLALCLPVLVVGMDYFGRSAINSIRNG